MRPRDARAAGSPAALYWRAGSVAFVDEREFTDGLLVVHAQEHAGKDFAALVECVANEISAARSRGVDRMYFELDVDLRPPQTPQHDENLPEEVPAVERPGERTP